MPKSKTEIKIPDPELRILPKSWHPWRWQIIRYGDGFYYGHSDHCTIRISTANFRDYKSAKKAFC